MLRVACDDCSDEMGVSTMRLAGAVLGLVLVFAASTASAADDGLITAFKSICLDTRGEATKASAVAMASGWQATAVTATEAAGGLRKFGKVDGDQHWNLLLENSIKPADSGIPLPTRRTACAIFRSPDSVDANLALRARMGVEPVWRDGATWWWTYIDRGATREYIAVTPRNIGAKAIEALESGPWVVVMAGPRGPGQMMMYSWVAKSAGATMQKPPFVSVQTLPPPPPPAAAH